MAGTSGIGRTGLASIASTRPAQDTDLDRLADGLRGWDTRFTQLAPGPGRGSIVETVLPAARLVRLVVDTSVALEALPLASHPEELFHIGTISPGTDRLLWQGLSVRPDMLMREEGEVPSRFAMPAGCELLVARLDRKRIESVAHVLRGPEDEPARRRTQLHPQSVATLAELRAQLRALMRSDLADQGERIGLAEDELYERVASMLAASPMHVDPPPETRRRALRRVEEYLHAHAGKRFSLSDLCLASECSERTLRTAFRECYGTSPMAFLKKLRLQGLRQDLRDAAPRSATVLNLALRWGFWHMGHLGRDYRLLFGERPSETLAGKRRLDGATGPVDVSRAAAGSGRGDAIIRLPPRGARALRSDAPSYHASDGAPRAHDRSRKPARSI